MHVGGADITHERVDGLGERPVGPELVVAVGAEDHEGDLGQVAAEVAQEQERGLVGPVQVLEDEQERLRESGPFEELAHAVQHVAAFLLGRQVGRRWDVVVALTERGHELGQLGRVLAEQGPEVGGGQAASGLLELVDVGLVGRGRVHVEAVATAHGHAETVGDGRRLSGQAALAEPGGTADQQHRTPSSGRGFDLGAELLAFASPADERRGLAVGQSLTAIFFEWWHEIHGPLGGDALELDGALIDEFVARRSQHPVHGVGGEDPAGRRQALDALGDDHGLAVEVALLGQDLAGVQPDAHLDVVETAPLQPTHVGLDLPGGGDRPTGRGERGHQPVAHLLDQHAPMGIDLAPGDILDLAGDLACGVVTEALIEPGRLDEVGEQDGHGPLGNVHLIHRRSVGAAARSVRWTKSGLPAEPAATGTCGARGGRPCPGGPRRGRRPGAAPGPCP